MTTVSGFTAFINGFITFFSPCVLPLLPLYFSYLAGEAVSTSQTKGYRSKLLINSVGFILGISVLNLLIGFGAKFISDYILSNKEIIRWFGGTLMILFGLYFVTGIHIKFLERDKKFVFTRYTPTFLKSFFLGFTFSLGWSACNGPIVASITLIASFQRDYLRAGLLMLIYTSGFAIPFMLSSILAGFFVNKFKKLTPYFGKIKIVSGIILIIMGILMLLNKVYFIGV